MRMGWPDHNWPVSATANEFAVVQPRANNNRLRAGAAVRALAATATRSAPKQRPDRRPRRLKDALKYGDAAELLNAQRMARLDVKPLHEDVQLAQMVRCMIRDHFEQLQQRDPSVVGVDDLLQRRVASLHPPGLQPRPDVDGILRDLRRRIVRAAASM